MIDFERFWMEGDHPYQDSADVKVPPGVTAEEIAEWEQKHGVTLPEPIRTALGVRNGGFVRNTSIEIGSLDEIVPADAQFWEWTELDDDEVPDHSLMFVFGSTDSARLLMNFNANGPEGSPSVYIDHHGESTNFLDDTILGYFENELEASDEPSVDWSETESGLSILARTTLDLSAGYNGEPASEEQVLARDGETLILFTSMQSPEGETLTRTTLPLPLDPEWANIQPLRPGSNGTFALHLQPTESAGIIHMESETNEDGRYKNTTVTEVPVYVQFESTDRAILESLRTQLFGIDGSAQGQAKQDRFAGFEAMLSSLPQEQRTAAMLQAMTENREETIRNLGPVPRSSLKSPMP